MGPKITTDHILFTFYDHRPNESGLKATTDQIYSVLITTDHHRPNILGPKITTDHRRPPQTWASAAAEKKDEWFAKFLRDTGARVHDKAVTSQDGGLTMPATPKVARKPGQVRRPRGARTSICRLKTVQE